MGICELFWKEYLYKHMEGMTIHGSTNFYEHIVIPNQEGILNNVR